MVVFPAGKNFQIGDRLFHFSVARSTAELMKGLAGAQDMCGIDGMLFDFDMEIAAIMTPRGLLFPIEVAFLKADGTITEIFRLDPEFGHNAYASEKVRFALEVPLGFFDAYNITVGTQLELGEIQ